MFSWKAWQDEWKVRTPLPVRSASVTLTAVSGMVHVSNIQQGARANSAADLLSRGQSVKVKVMSVAGNRVGLSMKDVDQATGRDLTPHLRIKSEAELAAEEERRHEEEKRRKRKEREVRERRGF